MNLWGILVKQVDMYVECERKFNKGFKFFEKIVADRMLNTTNQRQEKLSQESTALTSKMQNWLLKGSLLCLEKLDIKIKLFRASVLGVIMNTRLSGTAICSL